MAKKNDGGDKAVRNGIDTFLPAYLGAVREGSTLEEFAAEIGVKPLTVYQRVTKLRAGGLDVPHLAGETVGKASVLDRAAAILAQFNANG
jgi:hypothetical protein